MAKVGPAHRNLSVGDKSGEDVKQLQIAINARGKSRGLTKLLVDGQPGRQTIAVARQCARALGVSTQTPGVSLYVQQKIRNPLTRNPVQLARATKWRIKHPHGATPVPPDKPKINGNTVTGGSGRERATSALMEAARQYYQGISHRFYSQLGAWTVSHGITGEPHGYRSDCSQFAISIDHSAGVPDPAGTGYTSGNTDTLAGHLKEISRSSLKPADYVIYFNGTSRTSGTHHIERWVGNGDGNTSYTTLANRGSEYRDRTVGHGTPPVDYGDIDMIAHARFFTQDFSK